MGVDARARVGNRECECESESVDRASESVTKKGTERVIVRIRECVSE